MSQPQGEPGRAAGAVSSGAVEAPLVLGLIWVSMNGIGRKSREANCDIFRTTLIGRTVTNPGSRWRVNGLTAVYLKCFFFCLYQKHTFDDERVFIKLRRLARL